MVRFFCTHDWEFVSTSKIFESSETRKVEALPIRITRVYICKKCLKKKGVRIC